MRRYGTNLVWRATLLGSACLCGFWTIVWFSSLFYYMSFTFFLPTQSERTRVDVGYGMIYLTLNDDADPRSRRAQEGIKAFPQELRDQNIRGLLRFQLPIDELNGNTTAFGSTTSHDYRGNDAYSYRYWCSAPIPCLLCSIPWSLQWLIYVRRSFNKQR